MKAKNEYSLPVKAGTYTALDRHTSKVHQGKYRYAIDILCPDGTLVYPALEGEVRFVKDDSNEHGTDSSYWDKGNRIVIKHANGEYTAYEHLRFESARVKVGQHVTPNDVIAETGMTGLTNIEHLHFEIFRFTGPNINEDFETLEYYFPEERK